MEHYLNKMNNGENMDTATENRRIMALLKILNRYNLMKTVELLSKETKIRYEEVKDVEDLEDVNENEITELIKAMRECGEWSYNSQTDNNAQLIDPEVCFKTFENMKALVDYSLNIYKHELNTVLYPLFVQIYLKLVDKYDYDFAKTFVEKFKFDVETFYHSDVEKLLLITSPNDFKNNDLVIAMETDKFVIRMSRDTYSIFMWYVQDQKQEIIAEIVAKYLHFETYEDTPRSEMQCYATAGSPTGVARRQVNKICVYYGIFKKRDNQSNAPDIDRIPLPKLKIAYKLEKSKGLREGAKRFTLNKNTMPSVLLYNIHNAGNIVTCVDIAEDSSMIAIGFNTSDIQIWSLTAAPLKAMKSVEQLRDIDKGSKDVLSLIMDEESNELSRTFYGHSGPVYRCNFAPQKHLLLSCSEDGTIRLWSLYTWSCLVVYKGHLFPVWDVKFSPYGYYFASGSCDKTARLWATNSLRPLRIFVGHLADVQCVLFHPNSNYIASGSSDRTVRLWDVLTGQLVRLMTGHKGPICSMVFSTCGHYLASGSEDFTVNVWDLANGQLVSSLDRHEATIHTMAFSRDGAVLAVGGMDYNLTIWDFTKLTEEYTSRGGSNASHNFEPIDSQNFLLRTFSSKSTPFLTLHFSRRNLLIAAGTFKAN